MTKAKKIIAGTAIGSAALLGAFCTVTYECMFNIRISRIIGEKFSPAELPAPEAEEAPAPEITQAEPAPDLFGEAVGK